MASRKRRAQGKPRPASAAQGNQKVTDVKRRKLKPRDKKFLDGLAEGKSKRKAALDAGFSETTAEHTAALEKRLQDQLADLMPSVETIAAKIHEGVEAVETQTFSHVIGSKVKGTQQIQLAHSDKVAWTERRKYVELALILRGLMPGKPAIAITPPAGGGKFIVEFVDVAQLDEA